MDEAYIFGQWGIDPAELTDEERAAYIGRLRKGLERLGRGQTFTLAPHDPNIPVEDDVTVGYEDCRAFLHDHAVITLDDGSTVEGRVVIIDHQSVAVEGFAGSKQVRFDRITEIKSP